MDRPANFAGSVLFSSCVLGFVRRKHCTSCKCPRDVHDVVHQESVNVKDRLGLKASPQQTASILVMDINGQPTSTDTYAWIPAGICPDRVSNTRKPRILSIESSKKMVHSNETWL